MTGGPRIDSGTSPPPHTLAVTTRVLLKHTAATDGWLMPALQYTGFQARVKSPWPGGPRGETCTLIVSLRPGPTLTAYLAQINMCNRLPMLCPTPYTGSDDSSAC